MHFAGLARRLVEQGATVADWLHRQSNVHLIFTKTLRACEFARIAAHHFRASRACGGVRSIHCLASKARKLLFGFDAVPAAKTTRKRDWNVKQFLKKSALCSASCLQAVAIVGMGSIGAAVISTPAFAQDYTSGALAGTVTDESGNEIAGATVTVTSQGQGFVRTTTTTSNGAFRFAALPTGSYTVTVASPGAPNFTATDVRVIAGDTADLNIALTGTGDEIVVTGVQVQVPFSGATSGVNVNLEELVKRVPVGRDITNVMLLAPGTSRGDSNFGGKAANFVSIGGSSVAENAYYINGLNITNFDNYLGGSEVPFDFYQTVEVKSGGYSAEFGRATGGIVNAVSKAGGNDFEAAIHLNWAPNWLRSDRVDRQTYGDPDNDGVEEYIDATNRHYDKTDTYSATMEASGPIIKDRLFVYGLLEMRKDKQLVFDQASALAYKTESDTPFWAVKVDAYPIDNHHLEFTIFDTSNEETNSNLGYLNAYSGDAPVLGVSQATFNENSGGVNYVAKYTGNFTDWLTLSGAYGRMRDRFDTVPLDPGAGQPFMQNLSGGTINGVPQGGLFTGQTESIVDQPYKIQREFYRADADLFFTAMGDHHVRLGFDQEDNTLNHIGVSPGESIMCDGYLTAEACTGGLAPSGARLLFRPGNVVEINYYNAGGTFDARNRAFYIQDEWALTDRLTLNLGVRRDDFGLSKADGSVLVDLDKNYAPRIGATYELWDDHSGKVRAFFGQYYLPVASNTAFRQASPEVYFRERFNYSGFDGNGLPILGSQITSLANYAAECPFALTPGSSGLNCSVTGRGIVPDTSAAISSSLKATKESEWIVGYEHNFGEWTAGITYTHRNLDRSAEDMAIDAAVINYCEANGIAGCSATWTGFHQYVVTNPGSDLTVNLAGLDGREVTFTADDLAAIGFPKAKRKYDAVEFKIAHPWDGKWSFEANYTWSKSKGNAEGFVQSDFNQDDSGITQDFDQPGFLDGAYGYLPNHREHRIKAWGSYAITDRLGIGANVTVESPRKLNCFGYHPGSDVTDGSFENVYGAASHYCGGVLSPRGTAQESQWVKQVDLSVRYNIDFPTGQLVTLRADVFNVFNGQAVQDRNEIGDLDEAFTPSPTYGLATFFQAPRYVRLGLDIAF
jgi:outer membrane receptor protein involved in Fe transport